MDSLHSPILHSPSPGCRWMYHRSRILQLGHSDVKRFRTHPHLLAVSNKCGLNIASGVRPRATSSCKNPRMGNEKHEYVPLIVGGGDMSGAYCGDGFACCERFKRARESSVAWNRTACIDNLVELNSGVVSVSEGGCVTSLPTVPNTSLQAAAGSMALVSQQYPHRTLTA
jgi:hypothetical protein